MMDEFKSVFQALEVPEGMEVIDLGSPEEQAIHQQILEDTMHRAYAIVLHKNIKTAATASAARRIMNASCSLQICILPITITGNSAR